jgi:hypothetical protein
MYTQTYQQLHFIKMVANQLAKKFIQPLFESTQEKSYQANIGRLAEILDWAEEFYQQYYEKIVDWENFQRSNDNIYKTETLNDPITVFGKEKLKTFFAQNSHRTNYFFEKHSAVTKRYSYEQVYNSVCD